MTDKLIATLDKMSDEHELLTIYGILGLVILLFIAFMVAPDVFGFLFAVIGIIFMIRFIYIFIKTWNETE